MNQGDILRRYRAFDPATGRFDSPRGLREYARLLGMDAGHLSRILNGPTPPGRTVMERLARTFPAAATEMVEALQAQPPEAIAVAV